MNPKTITFSAIALIAILVSACAPSAAQPTAIEALDSEVALASSESIDMEISEDTLASATDANTAASYPVVDTNQTACYDDSSGISCPEAGETYYGQDAQYSGNQPQYQDNGDGTVTDLVTGLIWIQDAGDKMSYADALALAQNYSFAGYDDWRLPTIKELYSLMDFSGVDVSAPTSQAGDDPFIDTDYFIFSYGDTAAGERAIDSQWITSTIYVDSVFGNAECFFGVNFADGRIKCYPTGGSNNAGWFLRLVRGEAYGENAFADNGDGTISDEATGLTWQQADSGEGMDWPTALSYCENLSLGGSDEWRLPNIKELQSIVDYSRSPGTTNSAAIDPIFAATQITNEAGQADYGYYWSSTTHIGLQGGGDTNYISFGRGIGNMGNGWIDVHGAGSQRSDPKTGNPSDYPISHGPQGDAQRLLNMVRCVTGGVSDEVMTGGEAPASTSGAAAPAGPPQEAIDACSNLSAGAACTVGPVSGSCTQLQSDLACVPEGGPPSGAQQSAPQRRPQ